jgi:hypothetical protein
VRRLLLIPLFMLALPAAAQGIAPPPPALEPIPEPPPAVGLDAEPTAPGPTIAPGSKVEEFTTPDGQKYIRVVEPNGWEYVLVEHMPGQPAGARTQPFDSGVRVPMWLILEW